MMHHRTTDNATIQRLIELLAIAGDRGLTSWTLSSQLTTVCISTIVSEARRCGYEIDCVYERRSENGRKVYRYILKSKPEVTSGKLF